MRGDREIVVWSIILCISIILSACSKRCAQSQNTNYNAHNDELQLALDKIIQQEAMLTNVPIPLYEERILTLSYQKDENIILLGYKSQLSADQLIDYFMNQMERYGWKHIVFFEAQESILQFENPDYYCTILIKRSETNSSSFFIYIKRASTIGSLMGSELG